MPERGQETQFTPSNETQREFRDALGRFATGVTVVTAASPLGPLGITANSFAAVSLDPPLVLWSPARASRRFEAFAEARHFAIHVLGTDQDETCNRFVRDGLDFDGIDWKEGAGGTPLLSGCLARFECIQEATHEGGDHLIIVGRVTACSHSAGRALLFHAGTFGRFTDTP